jgi:hypothetical protein
LVINNAGNRLRYFHFKFFPVSTGVNPTLFVLQTGELLLEIVAIYCPEPVEGLGSMAVFIRIG